MFELPSTNQKKFLLTLDYAQHKFDKSKMSLLKVA
jgi:ATP-dependent Clp protease ATP-binding subunit ClpX